VWGGGDGPGVPGGEDSSGGDTGDGGTTGGGGEEAAAGRARRWYTRIGRAKRAGGVGEGGRGLSVLERGAGSGGAPVDGELGHGAVGPAGNNGKGGSTTASVGKEEVRSRGEGEGVAVVEKGKTDSSNTTWREMRTRREVRS
jgi:hypothetical protein